MSAKTKEITVQSFLALWFIGSLLVCIPPFLWHLRYFKQIGPNYRLVQALPVVLAVVVAAYLYLRRFGFWRLEPLFFSLPILVAAVTQPKATAVTLWILLATYSLGRWATKPLSLESGEVPVAFTAGFGVLILILYVLGKSALFYPSVFIGLLSVATIAGIPFWKDLVMDLLQPYRTWRNSPEMASPLTGLAVCFAALFAACGALVMLTPSLIWDVLYYHLPLAQIYAKHHHLAPNLVIKQSYYPQSAEVLMTLAMSLGGQIAAQLIVPFYFLLFLWLLLRTARECGASRAAAFLGVVAAGTLPFIHWTGSVPKNDMAMTAFQLASLYALIKWQKSGRFAWLVVGAFFCGHSFGVKHVALFGFLPLALMFGYAIFRQAKLVRSGLILAGVFLASGLFWQLETWIRTGNPVYPERTKSAVSGAVFHHSTDPGGPLKRYVELPWNLFFHGEAAFLDSNSPNPAGVFLVFFAPLPFLVRRERLNPAAKACAFFAIVYLAYWASMVSILRYAILPFALAAVAAGAALTVFSQDRRFWLRSAMPPLCFFTFVFGLITILTFEVNTLQVQYLLRRLDREQYLSLVLPTTGSLFYIAHLDPNASVFGAGNCSRFYAPDPESFSCDGEAMIFRRPEPGIPSGRFEYASVSYGNADLEEQILKKLGGVLIYDDKKYRAYRLQPPVIDGKSPSAVGFPQ